MNRSLVIRASENDDDGYVGKIVVAGIIGITIGVVGTRWQMTRERKNPDTTRSLIADWWGR